MEQIGTRTCEEGSRGAEGVVANLGYDDQVWHPWKGYMCIEI
jgi:hypothetical protein